MQEGVRRYFTLTVLWLKCSSKSVCVFPLLLGDFFFCISEIIPLGVYSQYAPGFCLTPKPKATYPHLSSPLHYIRVKFLFPSHSFSLSCSPLRFHTPPPPHHTTPHTLHTLIYMHTYLNMSHVSKGITLSSPERERTVQKQKRC